MTDEPLIFNDDEPIDEIQDVSGEKPVTYPEGKTKAEVFRKKTAPLGENEFTVLLKITGSVSGKDRDGLDLVTILDVSGSMKDDKKLEKMKSAMQFIIKKLGPTDRLSVVTFNKDSSRLCRLRRITENSQLEIENLVNGLVADDATNITAGLQKGLKVINDRRFTSGRVIGIMLMSDGAENVQGANAAQVTIGNVPVYTFGFGKDHDPKVLTAIANNSRGGTFSYVQNLDDLNKIFSQCLAGRLTVVVQDLKLTITQITSTIKKVSAGNYTKPMDKAPVSPVTVLFGDLYQNELRMVMVDLLLPSVDRPRSTEILKFTYTYSTGGEQVEVRPIIVRIMRTRTNSVEPEREEVTIEKSRLRTAQEIKEARILADESESDNTKLDEARDKLAKALNKLEDEFKESNPMIEMLKSELQQLLMLMKSQYIYETYGRPFAHSSETSHGCQRYAARGDVENLRFFATPRMDAYAEQAKLFDANPCKPPPTVDEDVKQEIAADPLAPIIGALSHHIQAAIQSLKSIDKVLNSSRT